MKSTLTQPRIAASLRRGFDPTALGALFVLTLRQHLRGRRVLILSLLFALPTVLAIVIRMWANAPPPDHLEFGLVLNLIPHALVTLTALLFSAGIIQDEVEEQTLTYLLLRPLPRWAIYLVRLAATVLVTTALTTVFTTLALIAIHWNTPLLWGEVIPGRALRIAAMMALAQFGYCSLFGFIAMATRRSLVSMVIGLADIISVEGLLATFPSVLRRLTVMFHFRVLTMRWLNPADGKAWDLDLDTAPSAQTCVLTMLGVGAVFALLGAMITMRREFRVKTPEGA